MTAPDGAAQPRGLFTAALAEELRVHMARKRVSGRELARRLHVSAQWISQRTRGTVPMDSDDMEMLAGALEITIPELLADAMRRVSEATRGTGDGAVTGTYTPRFGSPSSTPRPALTLIRARTTGYPDIAGRNGSSPATAGYGTWPPAPASARTVNNADAA